MYVIIEARKTSVIMMLSSPRCPLSGPLLALLSFFHFWVPAKLAQFKFSAAHLAIDLKFSLPWQKGQNLIKHLLCWGSIELGRVESRRCRGRREQKRERMQQIGADNFVGQHSEASGLEAKQGIQISSLWANECKTLL